jgi:hypothetical protein
MRSRLSLRPEDELLLCCARRRPDASETKRIRELLQPSLDWAYLKERACRHRLLPLLFYNIKASQPEPVISQHLASFQQEFLTNAWLTQLHKQELIKLIELFKTHGLRAMAVKGVALTAAIYDDLALRQAGDLDILVAERDFQHASLLLRNEGYKPTHLTTVNERLAAQSFHDQHYVRINNGRSICVDLHRHIMPAYFIFPSDFEALWECRQQLQLGDKTVAGLAPNDLLLYLCVHGARHAWPNLSSLCDVAGLIGIYQDELEWPEVLERAEAYRNQRMLLVGLRLAHDLLGVDLPEFVRVKAESDRVVTMLTRQVRDRLLFHKKPGSLMEILGRSAFRLRIMDTNQDRLRYIRYHIRLKAKTSLAKVRSK